MSETEYSDYGFASAEPSHVHERLSKAVFSLAGSLPVGTRILDIGCGTGALCGEFRRRGCEVVGCDLSETGITLARRTFPGCRFERMGVGELSLQRLGEAPFDLVVSTEVIEHLYAPKKLAHAAFEALRPGGRFIVTTPYHGYLKNLAISLCNHWDIHADPLWDGGHVKLFSRKTLMRLFADTGFRDLRFVGIGRLPYIWMSMAVIGEKQTIGKSY
jgi:2-polyprenyl-6-hydroxyphenyl methylase/3-demethylubiquinone-9 3-methyltransferase